MIDILRLVLQSLVIAIFISGLIGWCRVARFWFALRLQNQGSSGLLDSLIPCSRQERPTWTFADFLLAFGLRILLPVLLLSLMADEASIGEGQAAVSLHTDQAVEIAGELAPGAQNSVSTESAITQLSLQLIAIFASIGLTLAWLSILHRDSWKRIGFRTNWKQVHLALISTPLILSVVMIFSLIGSAIVEYQHPVLDALSQQTSPTFWTLTFFVTAIATPIFEEFIFRGLLQGSLQALADRQVDQGDWKPKALWPLLVSSFIFAIMHFPGQGAAPLPIFALSIGLGYLYRQTGSLIPPILVHVILNSITLLEAYTGQ